MSENGWWQRPRLRLAEGARDERRVSWLELFHDLVFVVVVAELAHYLAAHITPAGVGGYMLMFATVWWLWIGGTYYNARFETYDLSYRLIVFLQMLPVAGMAIFVHGGVGETSAQFALAYSAGRALIIFLWLRGAWHEPVFRPVALGYALGFSCSLALFIGSTFVPPPLRFWLWIVALAIDLATPPLTLPFQARIPRLSNSKLPERFGLFVLIVLGEAIVGTVSGVAELEPLTAAAALRGALGMALVFGLWWIYFDFVARHSSFRMPRPGLWWALFWGYGHVPLLMAIAAVSAAALNVLPAEQGAIELAPRLLASGAVAAALVFVALLEITLRRDPDEPTELRVSVGLKVFGAALALVIGELGQGLSPSALLAALLLPLAIQMAYGAFVWYRSPLSRQAPVAAEG